LRCSQNGYHPPECLAKIGYGPGMKVKKLKESFYIWATLLEPVVEICQFFFFSF
jgi:hypothetical protein